MGIAEQIYSEAKQLPEHAAREALDFIQFLYERYTTTSDSTERHSTNKESRWDLLKVNTKGLKFNREEANARR